MSANLECIDKSYVATSIRSEFLKSYKDNKFIINLPVIKLTAKTTKIGQNYYQKPEKLSLELFGMYEYAKIILLLNNLTSTLDFDPSQMNYKCLVPDVRIISKIIES